MNEIGSVMNLGVGILLLWLLWVFGWRPYREDSVRQQLFELRNDLFLYASEGGISFSDPAYMLLRRRIEALIRFAHKIGAIRVLVIGTKQLATPLVQVERENQQWQSSLGNLSAASHERLKNIHNRAYILVAAHIVQSSLVLLVVSLLALPFVAIYSYMASRSRSENELKVATEIFDVQKVEQQAILEQIQEIGSIGNPVAA